MTDPNTPSTEGTPQVQPLPPTTPPAPSYSPPAAAPAYGAPSNEQQTPPNPYGQAPGAAPYGQPYAPVASAPKTLSLIGMIAGIVGIVFFGWFGLASIAAVVLGFMGKKREPAAKGFWLTALITGFVGIGILLIWILLIGIGIIAGMSDSSYSSY